MTDWQARRLKIYGMPITTLTVLGWVYYAVLGASSSGQLDFTVLGIELLLGTPVVTLTLAFYFLPTLLALRNHRINFNTIFFINLFLGWTTIGWIIALALAVRVESAKLSQKREASRFGPLILAIAYNPDLPFIEELYAVVSPHIRVDFRRFGNECVLRRLFAADYSLALGATYNPKVQEVRDAYTTCIGEWANDFFEAKAPELLYDVQTRFNRYGQAVNSVNSRGGSPFIAVAEAFLEFCDCRDHARAILPVQSEVAMVTQAVTIAMKSWGF